MPAGVAASPKRAFSKSPTLHRLALPPCPPDSPGGPIWDPSGGGIRDYVRANRRGLATLFDADTTRPGAEFGRGRQADDETLANMIPRCPKRRPVRQRDILGAGRPYSRIGNGSNRAALTYTHLG